MNRLRAMLMLNAGQDKAVNAVADSVLRSRAGLASQTRGSSFLFLGPTGVGKTELAKALAELLFDDEKNMVSPFYHAASCILACASMELMLMGRQSNGVKMEGL